MCDRFPLKTGPLPLLTHFQEAADSFLGTQGYVWDTQSDMWLALLGAISALVLLGRLHDRQLKSFV